MLASRRDGRCLTTKPPLTLRCVGGAPMADTKLRFWRKVEKLPGDGCWLWHAAMNKGGYGVFRLTDLRRNVLAHRWAYTDDIGPIPKGLTLHHLCKTPSCVRPSHMKVCTHADNIMEEDGMAGIQARKTHCPVGHLYTPETTYLQLGWRSCKICRRQRFNAWKERNAKPRMPECRTVST